MAAPTYKSKTVIDLGASKAYRQRMGYLHRWGVYFFHSSPRGTRAEMEQFPTLAHAKAAIDGDMENAL